MQNPTLITLEHLKQAGVNPETTEVDKWRSHLNDQLEERFNGKLKRNQRKQLITVIKK